MTGKASQPWLDSLNPRQREAATHGSGPLLILAGAGSGKTRVIVHRIAHLIRGEGIDPYNILAVTFTNKAADEMKARVAELLGMDSVRIWVSTFHSMGAQILRRHIDRLGYSRDFVIYDEAEQLSLIRSVLKDHGYDPKVVSPKLIRSLISMLKREARGSEGLDSHHDPRVRVYAPVIRDYEKRLFLSKAVDFGDLLQLTLRLFEEHEDVLDGYRSRFLHVLVDEYQDTNRVQYLLVKKLAQGRGNICVVGDEDQSIYGWRGADISNILNFEEDFAGAGVVLLEQNYRSTKNVIEAASALISRNESRKPKQLWTDNPEGELIRHYSAADEEDEARWVIEEALRMKGMGRGFSQMAVFYRTHAQSRVFEERLRDQNLPYSVYGGPGFYDRREVKDILAYLKFIVNPEDEVSLLRIINVPARGIGAKTLEALVRMKRQGGLGWMKAIAKAGADPGFPARARTRLNAFYELMEELIELSSKESMVALCEKLIDMIGYRDMLKKEGTMEARVRLENLEELINALASHQAAAPQPDLASFLEKVSLAADIDGFDPEAGRLSLMTLHSAKGLEFPVVFMVGMAEGLFPHARSLTDEAGMDEDSAALEEERRLCYVGMTRAKELLVMSWPDRRMVRGRKERAEPSRFLAEIPPRYVRRASPPSLLDRPKKRKKGRAAEPVRVDMGDSEIVYDEGADYDYPAPDSLKPGDRVMHPAHGPGVVKRLEESGDKLKVVVRFSGSTKKFILKFAPLSRLD